MRAPTVLVAPLLVGLTGAVPTEVLWPRDDTSAAAPPGYRGPQAVDLIEGSMPDSKTCDKTKYPQCTTATEAAPHFINAMAKYKIYDSWEIAAVISLTAMESMSLKYKQPAVESPDKGKGTSNMQSGEFNLKFANSIPELASQVGKITGGSATLTDTQKSQVLKLLQADEYNFSSGAWFLATQCTPSIRQGIVSGTRQGWLDYVTKCVGVPAAGTDDVSKNEWARREQLWNDAMIAFGLSYNPKARR